MRIASTIMYMCLQNLNIKSDGTLVVDHNNIGSRDESSSSSVNKSVH